MPSSRSEPLWLPVEEVIASNAGLVADTGEPHALLKPGELESACARPRNKFEYEDETDAVILATALLYGIAKNHAFVQGNKRTGLEAALLFLRANGWDLDPFVDSEDFGELILALLRDEISEKALTEILRPYVFAL